MRLDFYSPANTTVFGYGNAYRNFLKFLGPLSEKSGIELAPSYSGGDVQIYFGVPFDVFRSEYERKSERFLCFTMWESTTVTSEVMANLEGFDGLIVPSNFCAEIFKANGYAKPVYVAPLGIDPDKWPVAKRDPMRWPLRILWQGTSLYDRKGAIETLHAICDLGLPHTQIYFKMNWKYFAKKTSVWDYWSCREWIENTLVEAGYEKYRDRRTRLHKNLKKIQMRCLAKILSREDMYLRLLDCDLSVYPSRGEGFGLIPLEHMASGLPLIISNNTGMKDYIDPQYMKVISCEERCATMGQRFGIDYTANHDELKAAILWAYQNREEASELGLVSAKYVRENWSIERGAERILDIAGEVYAK